MDILGLDFGLSIDETKERPVTRAGTLDYMAPEVLNCPNKIYPEDNKKNKSLLYNFKVLAPLGLRLFNGAGGRVGHRHSGV